jgi:peptidoglycan hydrolase CwlO-like protein
LENCKKDDVLLSLLPAGLGDQKNCTPKIKLKDDADYQELNGRLDQAANNLKTLTNTIDALTKRVDDLQAELKESKK